MRIDLFRMERTQSVYENQVEYNLSESGVTPLTVDELLAGSDEAANLGSTELKYPQSNGTEELRERIGAFYGAKRENVIVANGGSEANFLSIFSLVEKSDRVAVMLPNYMQTWGLARGFGAAADAFWMQEQDSGGKQRWGLDIDSLHKAVGKKTKLIILTNPNNPTGGVLSEEEMDEVVRVARKANAWLLADEIYRGAELNGQTSLTFWGRYDKLLITSGLSKAFGMPGLRIGWVVASPKVAEKLWSYKDYTTISLGALSDRLATIAMEPKKRDAILERTRGILRRQLPTLEQWIHSHDDIFTYIPPVAGAITYIRYKLPISSTALCVKLREDESVLINPGDQFGMGKYLRVGFGYDIEYTLRGLERLDKVIEQLKQTSKRPARAKAARRGAA